MKFKNIFGAIVNGILNGFPMVQSIRKEIKKNKVNPETPLVSTDDEEAKVNNDNKFNFIAIITELVTVGLIISFMLNKLSFEQLIHLINLLN